TGGKGNPKFVRMRRILIVLRDSFADLSRSNANDRVCCGIVIGPPAEYLNPEPPLVDAFCFSCECPLGHEAQEHWKSLTVAEVTICQEPFQLVADFALFHVAQIRMSVVRGICHIKTPYSPSDYTSPRGWISRQLILTGK